MDMQLLSEAVQSGDAQGVSEMVKEALDAGVGPEDVLNNGLLAGMNVIGGKFKANEVFIPEVLIAARAMNAGMEVLEPALVGCCAKPVGKAVIGTVKGDLHDIGKNLVQIMLKGAGIEVIDIGIDVPAEKFIEQAEAAGADIICMSALLTTTMPQMEVVIKELQARGLRDKYVVMIGGAPVSESFGKQIGADYYTADAASAAETARDVLQAKA